MHSLLPRTTGPSPSGDPRPDTQAVARLVRRGRRHATATSRALPLALAGLLAMVGCSKPEPVAEPLRSVRSLVVQPEKAGVSVEFPAEVRARTESRLSFRVAGKLVRRTVELGQPVKAQQVLAQLDPQDLRLAQQAAGAAQTAAQVQLDQAQADFQRFRELREQGFISAAELERREATLKAAQAQVAQAKAQAGVQGNQAGYATLLADRAGIVTGIDAEPGMVVAAGAPVLRVAQDGPRDVVFSVPEDKVLLLRAAGAQPGGLSVRLTGDQSATLPAQLREVAAAADPVTRTFLVKADIGPTAARLGGTAVAVLNLAGGGQELRLPSSSVAQVEGRTAVWVLDGATLTVKPQAVEVGPAQGNWLLVKSGLQPGQEVVTAGVHVLTPGLKVRRYSEPTVVDKAARTTP
jgi:membrane fusion protein, multidrug efflux system